MTVRRRPSTIDQQAIPRGPYVAIQLAPDALVQAAWQTQPETRAAPLIVAGDRGVMRAVSPEAVGVRPGQTLAQARLVGSDLRVVSPDPVAARLLYDDLLRTLSTVSPIVQDTDPAQGLAVLDAHGCAALWGCREDGWTGDALARGVCATLTANGIGVRAGCGPSPLVARLVCAQTQPGAVRALAPAEAKTCIGRLPLGDPALGLPAPVVSALQDVGVRRVADFLRLSYAAVVERWGVEVGMLHRQLAGRDSRPLRRWTAAPALVLHRTVDDCASALVVDAILNEMCADLQTRLATAAQAVATITLRMTLDGERRQIQQSRHWPALHTLVPLRQAVLALRARCSIDAAVTAIEIRATDVQPPVARQEGLWTAATDRKRERLAGILTAYAQTTGTPLQKRWRRDALTRDGWTCEDASAS